MWSDIFYPGNPDRRERLIRKHQELIELMKGNFRATNQLIETLNEHLHLSFSPIALNEKATVKENCDVIIERIHEIQAEVEKIDTQLKEKLEPTLYEKLLGLSLTVHDHRHVSLVLNGVFSYAAGVITFSTVATGVIGWLIKNGQILTNIRFTISNISRISVIGGVLAGLLIGIDMIVGAVEGSKERGKLEAALEDYDNALEEFRPASEEYQDSITYVRVKVEMRK